MVTGGAHQNQRLTAPPFTQTRQRLAGHGLTLFVRFRGQACNGELGFDVSAGHAQRLKVLEVAGQ